MKKIAIGILAMLSLIAVQRPAIVKAEDSAALIAKWDGAWAKVNDYKEEVESHVTNGNNHEDRKFKIWFKKPLNIRSEIIEGNRGGDKGSVACYTGGDRVTGHQGGFLSGISLSLGLDDKKTTSIRGARITELAFSRHLEVIHMYEKGKAKMEVGTGTVDGKPVTTLTCFSSNNDFIAGNGNIAKDVFYYDNTLNLPVQWDRYESNGALVVHVNYRNIQVNTGVDDSAFQVRSHPQ